MARRSQPTLVDRDGMPFAPRIERILLGLCKRLRRQFPHLREELALAEVLEEVGRRLALREQMQGELANLQGYAWVAARSVAISSLRRGTGRMEGLMVAGKSGEISLGSALASEHTVDEIESRILLDELLRCLDEGERLLFEMKQAGFSSAEIAERLRRSVASVDTSYFRARERLREVLAGSATGESGSELDRPRGEVPRVRRRRPRSARRKGRRSRGYAER